jgi:hypothetical protein
VSVVAAGIVEPAWIDEPASSGDQRLPLDA